GRWGARGPAAGGALSWAGTWPRGGGGRTRRGLATGRLRVAGGDRPFFLPRGYGATAHGPLRVEAGRHGAAEVGDEPLLLARLAPTVVAKHRPAGAALGRENGRSVIIMDGGF